MTGINYDQDKYLMTKMTPQSWFCGLWWLYRSSPADSSAGARVDSESRFAIFLARILWIMRLASRENISASLTSLTRREKCDILSSLLVLQFVSLAFARLTNKQSHNYSEKLVGLKILQSRVKISNDSRESHYEISVWETRKYRYGICRSESCCEISFCETRKKRFLLRNFVARLAFRDSVRLTRSESRYKFWLKNLAKISREFWV